MLRAGGNAGCRWLAAESLSTYPQVQGADWQKPLLPKEELVSSYRCVQTSKRSAHLPQLGATLKVPSRSKVTYRFDWSLRPLQYGASPLPAQSCFPHFSTGIVSRSPPQIPSASISPSQACVPRKPVPHSQDYKWSWKGHGIIICPYIYHRIWGSWQWGSFCWW